MYRVLFILLGSNVLFATSVGAAMAQTHRLSCQGEGVQGPVVIEGVRTFQAHNLLGDGFVQFDGSVQSRIQAGRLQYDGYTAVGPFAGVISGDFPPISVSVLDNTGGQMIIYDGGVSTGAPAVLARLVCSWG